MGAPNTSTVDLPLPMFGGRVTQYDEQTLPPGASPLNQDVIFPPGAVATRPGLENFFNTIAGNPTIRYVKTYSISHNDNPIIALDGNGVVYIESAPEVITPIGTTVPGCYAKSVTAFGKEYIAFGDGNYGIGLPMQYDGTFFDRVSQVGPGAPGAIGDSFTGGATNITSLTPVTDTITGIERFSDGYIVMGLTSGAADGIAVGQMLTITGTVNYNGTWPIAYLNSDGSISVGPSIVGTGPFESVGSVQYDLVDVVTASPISQIVGGIATITGTGGSPSPTTAQFDGSWDVVAVTDSEHFRIDVTGGSVAIAGGALGEIGAGAQNGNISMGPHGFTVIFITRQGYFTKPAPPIFWNAGGNFTATAGQIPIGPKNVVARVLAFTPANSKTFYILPNFYIYDNTTTSLTADFIDSNLLSGTDATPLFDLIELGECSTVISYSSRLFWAGERNKVNNFLNLTFDGGWALGTGAGGADTPLGWSNTSGFGGSREQNIVVWGDAYRISTDAIHNLLGEIQQGCYADDLGVRILNDLTAYSVRIKVIKDAGLAGCDLNISISSVVGGFSFLAQITAAQMSSATFTEFILPLIDNTHSLPSDTVLTIQLTSPGGNAGHYVIMDCIEIFPTAQPYLAGQVRASYAVGNNPVASAESYNGVSGLLIPGENYGEIVHSFFRLLDNKLYMNKERSMYVTQDDGQNEPALWVVSPVSDVIGSPSVLGVDYGEGWAIIADHTGVYVFDGGTPIKISQEIQPDWDTINWAADNTIYVCVDRQSKRIHVGAPTGSSMIPNVEFVCDYSQLNDAQDIISHPQAYYSTFAPGKLIAPGKARKWTIWNISCFNTSSCIRNDGTVLILRGNAAGTGKVYNQSKTQLSDDGVAINSYYQTYYFPDMDAEQMLQLGAHRKHFEYLTLFVYGDGEFTTSIEGPQSQRIDNLEGIPDLSNTEQWDQEMNLNWEGERASFLFGTNAVGSWFYLSKFCPSVSKSIIPVRGVN